MNLSTRLENEFSQEDVNMITFHSLLVKIGQSEIVIFMSFVLKNPISQSRGLPLIKLNGREMCESKLDDFQDELSE